MYNILTYVGENENIDFQFQLLQFLLWISSYRGGGGGQTEKMDCLSNILATDSGYFAHPLSLCPQTPCMDVEVYLHSLKAIDTPY